jgi:uncharacterized protein YecE (DUF72 family)
LSRLARIGCAGWSYADWRGRFYPEGLPQRRWLEHYAAHFDTVEINSTFYRLPKRDAVAGWTEQVPPGFIFAVKASRYLTHIRRLRDVRDGFARFTERIEPLAEAGLLGPVLWQLPANFHRNDDVLRDAIEELGSGQHAIEFRDPSWFVDPVRKMLREQGIAAAVGDDPGRSLPVWPPTADFAYLRLHRGRRGRRGNYSPTELDEWAAVVRLWRRRAEVFVYLNNDWEGFAVRNAIGLRERVEESNL